MKYQVAVFILVALFTLAGCSTSQVATPIEPTVIPPTQVSTVTAAPTASATPAPTFTLTPSPTIFMSPTATPENFVLAEKGYDIADVRLSFPSEDTLVVKFKFRLEESRKSRDTYIFMSVPAECRRGLAFPYFLAKGLTGEARISFKMTLQGVCDAEVIEFTMYPDPNTDANPPFYREYVLQPYRIVRSAPAVNSKTANVENFAFENRYDWRGVFTFDYSFSEEIPLQQEEYVFAVRGFGPDAGCAFWAQGPVISESSGRYEIPLDLYHNLLYPYQNCLNGLDKYTYTQALLFVWDTSGGATGFSREFNTPYTLVKTR